MIYRRGEWWWYKFEFAGQLFQESARTKNQAIARRAERKRHQELEESLHGIKKRVAPKRFAIAASEWFASREQTWSPRTAEFHTRNLEYLNSFFGSLLAIDINAGDVASYQKKRQKDGASATTINHETGTLRSIFRRLRLWENLSPDVTTLRVDSTVGKALTIDEERRLLEACAASRSRTLLPFVQIALNTGLRKGEIQALTWGQVDFLRQEIRVGKSKTKAGTNRIVPLNRQALAVLQGWVSHFPNRAPDHFVFPSSKVGLSGNERKPFNATVDPTVAAGSVKSAWMTAKYTAGVEVRFHDTRHTCATRLLERGASLSIVARIFGWSASTVAAMSLRYGHISSDATRKALDSLVEPAGASDPDDAFSLTSRS